MEYRKLVLAPVELYNPAAGIGGMNNLADKEPIRVAAVLK
jgi:hypothetical protein